MTAHIIVRELGGRHGACRCPAHEDRSPSLSVRERDGVVLVHCHAGCSQAEVIAALRARGLWPERERPEWTPQQRAEWAHQRRDFERDLPAARYWRRAVMALLEDAVTLEKAKLFDPIEGDADTAAIRAYEGALARLRASGEAMLVQQYRDHRAAMPRACAALVRCMQDRERAEVAALVQFMATTEPPTAEVAA